MRGLFEEVSAEGCNWRAGVTGGRRKKEVAMVGRGNGDRVWELNVPLGAAKWITLPSSLNMLTSSIA